MKIGLNSLLVSEFSSLAWVAGDLIDATELDRVGGLRVLD